VTCAVAAFARWCAAAAGLAIQFDEGDAQQLPYDDALFKVCCKRPTNME